MIKEMKMTVQEVDDALNKRSGFEGICNHHDVREIEELARAGDEDCQLALDMFAYRAARFIGGTVMALSGCDAIVFTGGIGQNDPYMRARILKYASHMGIKIDPERNSRNERTVTTDDSEVPVFVIPANEELVIARDTARIVGKSAKKPAVA